MLFRGDLILANNALWEVLWLPGSDLSLTNNTKIEVTNGAKNKSFRLSEVEYSVDTSSM